MKEIIGLEINRIFVGEGEHDLYVDTNAGVLHFGTFADCCSETWVADILGVEVLVDMLDHRVTDGESESTVLGPFYRENPPVLPKGASIIKKTFDNAQTVKVSGRISDTAGRPIEGVTIDVWEDAPNGLYDLQDPEQPAYNLRGRFTTDANGESLL